MHSPATPKQINMRMEPKIFASVEKRAAEKGYPISTYARLMFDAAYAERIGYERGVPATDAELDEMVRAVFCLSGEFKPEAIAKATGIPETLVSKILAGWKAYSKSLPGGP